MPPKLFIFYCGGKANGARIEVHDVIIAIGDEVKNCYPQILQKWFGEKAKLHIDGYLLVDGLDGYRLELVNTNHTTQPKPEKKIYFVNLGGTIPGKLYEHHEPILVIAGSNMGAMSRARSLSVGRYQDKHVDNILDVDNLIDIAGEIGGWEVKLIKDTKFDNYVPKVENVYWFVK
jgi:hypothetical protein